MRFARAAPIAMALAMSCSPAPSYTSMAACLTPPPQGAPGQASLAALLDRADVIVHATIKRTERTNTPGNYDDQGARRVTLRTIEVAKGAAPPEFSVVDGPCPMSRSDASSVRG